MGLGLIFVPLSTIAYATLERPRMAEAAGIYSLVRTIGSAYAQRLGLSPTDPHTAAVIGQQLGVQAALIAMLDVFALIAWSFVVMLPLLLLLRRSAGGAQGERHGRDGRAGRAGDAAAAAH